MFSTLIEAAVGVLLGSSVSLAMHAIEMAGGLMDLQTGLSMSHTLNPINGIQTTVLSQFKFMLAVVVFLSANAHHLLIAAFVRSYSALPTLDGIETTLPHLLQDMCLIALQVAAPVMAVGFLVDCALGIVARAVPQMQATYVGAPAKVGIGLLTVSIGLPAAVAGTTWGVRHVFDQICPLFRM
jgi:flagellar biosynthetic protein FliR